MFTLYVEGEHYPVIQNNGQRIIGPCLNWQKFNQNPEKTREIFIYRIPRTLTEEQLMPIFCRVGPVYKFRLMMNFSGQNRGYAYLQYVFEEHYYLAFQILSEKVFVNNLMIYQVCMTSSLNICALQMGGLSSQLDVKLVMEHIKALVPCNAIVLNINRKKQLELKIEFPNHRCAALAKRTLLSRLSEFGRGAFVKWEPQRNHG